MYERHKKSMRAMLLGFKRFEKKKYKDKVRKNGNKILKIQIEKQKTIREN